MLKQKASSQTGASITFALLLFLVCAIVSSIVIVAATAVGGRASKMAEMDQRYYAVNSAAELVRDILEAPRVTVETGTQTTSTVDQDDVVVAGTTPTTTPLPTTTKVDDEPVAGTDTSLLVAAALQLSGVEDPPALPTAPLALTASGSGSLDTDALAVDMMPTMPPLSGDNLFIDITNQDTSRGAYTLRLTFKADRTVSNDTQTTYGAKTPLRDESGKAIPGEYTTTRTETQKTVTTLRWKLIDLVTVANVAEGC